METTMWQDMKKFIGNKTGELVTRQFLIWFVLPIGHNEESIDTYRRIFTKLGYLVTVKRGVYKLKKKIPAKLTLQEARNKAYPKCGRPNPIW